MYKKQGMALLSRVGESVKHVTGGYKLRSRPLEFAAIGEYLDTFALKLGTIDRIAQRIIKEEIGERPLVVLLRDCVCRHAFARARRTPTAEMLEWQNQPAFYL